MEKLPNELLSKIFERLSLKDYIRIGRLNKRFHELSKDLICNTKILDLNNGDFTRLPQDSFSNLLNSFAHGLEKITFPFYGEQLVAIFSEFTCPNLTTLQLGNIFIEQYDFDNLIRNSENLKTLTWDYAGVTLTYPNVVSQKLETLKIRGCNNAFIGSIIGRCPNLRRFVVTRFYTGGPSGGTSLPVLFVLNEFFATIQNIRSLAFPLPSYTRTSGNYRTLQDLGNLWQLSSLRHLRLFNESNTVNDNALVRISMSFPNLETLEIIDIYASDQGIGTLASLNHLRKLTLTNQTINSPINTGIEQIARRGYLREAQFGFAIIPQTLKSFIDLCPELRFLWIKDIENIFSLEDALGLVQSFEVVRRDITIRIQNDKNSHFWESAQIKEALQRKVIDGCEIKFEFGDFIPFRDADI